MSESYFESLLEKGDKEDLAEAQEILWAAERGKGESPEVADVPGLKINMDYDLLEKIALMRTPLEWLEDLLKPIPSRLLFLGISLFSLVWLLAGVYWASHGFSVANFSTKLAIITTIVTPLGLLTMVFIILVQWLKTKNRKS